jgi:glycosyltransferase involved in cell wall biosynthesis
MPAASLHESTGQGPGEAMHILHLIKQSRHCNGNVNVAVDLACGQVQKGHQVVYASAGGHYDTLLDAHGVQRENFGIPTDVVLATPSITTVCGLHPRKGVHDLLAAFRLLLPEFPNWHLNIIGGGPDRDKLEALGGNLDSLDQRISSDQSRRRSLCCGSRKFSYWPPMPTLAVL